MTQSFPASNMTNFNLHNKSSFKLEEWKQSTNPGSKPCIQMVRRQVPLACSTMINHGGVEAEAKAPGGIRRWDQNRSLCGLWSDFQDDYYCRFASYVGSGGFFE